MTDQPRHGKTMHRVPSAIILDPGSAATSVSFMNLCKFMRIPAPLNQMGQARAKGQVEKAQALFERGLESES